MLLCRNAGVSLDLDTQSDVDRLFKGKDLRSHGLKDLKCFFHSYQSTSYRVKETLAVSFEILQIKARQLLSRFNIQRPIWAFFSYFIFYCWRNYYSCFSCVVSQDGHNLQLRNGKRRYRHSHFFLNVAERNTQNGTTTSGWNLFCNRCWKCSTRIFLWDIKPLQLR
jgi:hypothetical protein